jgi:uncharacterized protein YciI
VFFVVLRDNVIPRAQWPAAMLGAHLDWATDTFASGELLLSGPANGNTGGIYLLEAKDTENAWAILARDPVNTNGYCTYRLMDWDIQRGKDKLTRT